ncbi:putative lipoprotein [Sulfitobacter noctilucae]|uniref:DUF3833 domain-containing protein n=1 Tax=Sulfitobacter noctilucae TaxID=1342302 RepID=UPI000469AFCE|nr:DUF3833 domain-containing protein [Sulfitobacter noctilucae]KIN70646.1 putative lipoprotein [Sulfitobacter noctilucae]
MRLFVILGTLLVLLTACTGKPAIDDANLSNRVLKIEEFFNGRVLATGQFQDTFGTVRRRFDVEINGTWDGKVLTLIEDFDYADGTKEQRIWRMSKTGPNTWTGTADGVLGEASGQASGDAFNWVYRIDLPVPDGTLRVAFDDWLWLVSDTRVYNRAYVKKYGVDIGEVHITFDKVR